MDYVCPLCGKAYPTAVEMSKCVSVCARKEDNKQITDKLNKLEKQINDKTTELQDLVKEYNKISHQQKMMITTRKTSSSDYLDNSCIKPSKTDSNSHLKSDNTGEDNGDSFESYLWSVLKDLV